MGFFSGLERLNADAQKVCNNLHTRQFCPIGVLELMDARNQGFGSRLFFGSCFSIPRSAPLDFLVSVKGRNAIFLADRRFILFVEPLFALSLDRVDEFDIKIVNIWANTDNNATYIVGDVFRVVAPEVEDTFPKAPVRVDAKETLT
jgi:hypothetical protein